MKGSQIACILIKMVDEPGKQGGLPSDEDIAARFQTVRDQLNNHTPAGDELELDLRENQMVESVSALSHGAKRDASLDQLESQMSDLADSAKRTRQARSKHVGLDEKTIKSGVANARATGMGLVIFYMIVGCPLAGAGIGYLLDKLLGTSFLMIALTVTGCVGGFGLAIPMMSRHMND